MEDFRGSLNGGGQEETSVGKGIIFAFIGMIIGAVPLLIVIGLIEWRIAFIGGAAVGFGVSYGWHLGKGSEGGTRQIVMILFSIFGAIFGTILGYTILSYRFGIGRDFMSALDFTTDMLFNGFDHLFGDRGEVTRDALFATAIAVAVSWKKFNPNTGSDLVELDNDGLEELEGLNADNPISTSTDMDDVLNQEVPTLDVDQDWSCAKCAATNRSIVDTCEFCGESR